MKCMSFMAVALLLCTHILISPVATIEAEERINYEAEVRAIITTAYNSLVRAVSDENNEKRYE